MSNLNDDIVQLRLNLQVVLENTLSIIELNENVINIANDLLGNISKELDSLNIGGGVKQKIEHSKAVLAGLNNNQQIAEQKSVIREQVIVLFVGSLESYLAEIIQTVGNIEPERFSLKEPNEKITFTQDMLKSGFMLGDAITEHLASKGYSFQDLASSLRVFENYLAMQIELSTITKDNLILCAACRNSIVHNSSRVDRQFLKQVRETSHFDKYKLDDYVDVDNKLIHDSLSAIQEFADQITVSFTGEDS
jgi:hypothetical protein